MLTGQDVVGRALQRFYDAAMPLPEIVRALPMLALTLACMSVCGIAAAQVPPVPPAQPTPAAVDVAKPALPAVPAKDVIRVTLPKESAALLGSESRTGRMLVFLAAKSALQPGEEPLDAPFFDSPQPMYSVAVSDLVPGATVTLGADAIAFPEPIAMLDGTYRIQAVFDRNDTERGHVAAGNLISGVSTVTFHRDQSDPHELALTVRIPAPELPKEPNLRWFEMKSAILSRAAGRDVVMRAGVALPTGWEDPNFRRRMFPAVYVVPGFGGRYTSASGIARMLATPGTREVMPQAVWIVLDPEAALGHHGFVDSPANGPWAKALTEEFIPELERQFRLIPRVDARIITGHSSGGWSSLWLQLTHPEIFGACFSSSPDPVDFSKFQAGDLYGDTSIFTDSDGKERPSYRVPLTKQFDTTRMTVRDEAAMERVLGPARNSGEQWDAWSAMWSMLDPVTKLPRPMFESVTGTIDHGVVRNEWARYDIAALVRADPTRYVPILRERVRLLCGARDSYYLDRGVQGLKDALQAAMASMQATGQMLPDGPGYVEIVPEETHDTMGTASRLRWNAEMREYLNSRKLD